MNQIRTIQDLADYQMHLANTAEAEFWDKQVIEFSRFIAAGGSESEASKLFGLKVTTK